MKLLWVFVLSPLVSAFAAAAPASQKAIKHGEFLVGYGGCNDCDTPG